MSQTAGCVNRYRLSPAVLCRPPDQAVGGEDEGLDGAEEQPGERGQGAGRFEVRAVAPSGEKRRGTGLLGRSLPPSPPPGP